MKRRWVYPNASCVSSGDGSGTSCPLAEASCSPKQPSDHQNRWRESYESAEKKQLHRAALQENENRMKNFFFA